jgi:hypothetical protein
VSDLRSNGVAPDLFHPNAPRLLQNPSTKKLVFVTNGIFPVTDSHGVDLLGLIRGAESRRKSLKINDIKSYSKSGMCQPCLIGRHVDRSSNRDFTSEKTNDALA